MLTGRGSMLLIIAVIGGVAGLLGGRPQVALGGLVLLVWIAIHWIGIRWLAMRQPALTRVHRDLRGLAGETPVLVIHQTVQVRVRWSLPRNPLGLQVGISESLPESFELVEGHSAVLTGGGRRGISEMDYRIRPAAIGRFEMSGLAVHVNDRAGLFHLQRFVPCSRTLTVLPWMIRPQTTAPVVKPHNVQSLPGHHAWRRSGLSAELLGIRDYQPGDPPRTIAWKATARTGHWMSREFEMEVPVRSTLICGLSTHQFSDRPATSVADRIITAAASLARLLLADRDPVALMLAADQGTWRLGHGNGQRHLVRMLHGLLDASSRAHSLDRLGNDALCQCILDNAWRRFPELFDGRVNSMPATRQRWLPARRKRAALQRRLALVLGQLLQLPVGSEYRLMADRQAMRSACLRYAEQYPVRRELAGTDAPQSTSASAALEQQMANCLMQTAHHARDNELFVLIGCFPESGLSPGPLRDAIRVCRANRHRVIAIDTPPARRPHRLIDPDAARIVTRLQAASPVEGGATIRRELTRMGVRYSRLDDPEMMQMVVNELEFIRTGRARTAHQRAFAH